MKKLSSKQKFFLAGIYLLTFLLMYASIKTNYIELKLTSANNIIFFAILVVLTETFTVPVQNLSVSTTSAITVASYILFGPLSTLMIYLIGYSFRVIKTENKYKHIFNTPFYGTLFNYCVFTLSIVSGNFVYKIALGNDLTSKLSNNVIPIVLFCIINFFVNISIISILASLLSGKNITYFLFTNVRFALLNLFIIAPFGVIISAIFNKYQYLGVLLMFFPLILCRYTLQLYIDSKSKYVQTMDVLMSAMEARDKYTQGHSKRVGEIAQAIATELKYSEWKLEYINVAAILHDVGKIGIDDSILNKPGKLTEEEYNAIKQHPVIGYNIIKSIKDMDRINHIVKHHHERYDGKGYPDGMNHEQLSLDVFIIQLADTIDAMATDRPYRLALSEEEIIEEIQKYRGTQFHPKVVDAYLKVVEKRKKAV